MLKFASSDELKLANTRRSFVLFLAPSQDSPCQVLIKQFTYIGLCKAVQADLAMVENCMC